MAYVEAVKTPATKDQVADAIGRIYPKVTGRAPTLNSILFPLSQSALEVAAWRSMYNWNPGFVTAFAGGDYFILDGNSNHFSSYGSLDEGITVYLSWLHRHGVLPYADEGDLDGYVDALQRACYVGCDPGVYPSYKAGIARYIHQFGGTIKLPSTWGKTLLAGGALLGVSYLTAEYIRHGALTVLGRRIV